MKKKYVLIFTLLIVCGFICAQNTNITFDDKQGVAKSEIIASVKTFVYVLVNLGLAIGAVPIAKKIFSGEPGAYKGIVVWLVGIISANVLIDPMIKVFANWLK